MNQKSDYVCAQNVICQPGTYTLECLLYFLSHQTQEIWKKRVQHKHLTKHFISAVSRRICYSLSSCPLLLLSVDTLLRLEVWCDWHSDKMNSLQVTLKEGALMSQSVGLSQQQTWMELHKRETAVMAVVSLTLRFVFGGGDVVKGWWVKFWCHSVLKTKSETTGKQ